MNSNLLVRKIFLSNQFSAAALDSNMIHFPVIGASKGVDEGLDLRKLAQSLHIPINPQFGGSLIVAGDDVNQSWKYEVLYFGTHTKKFR